MRYMIITVYNDLSVKTEHTNNLQQALGAAAVYLDGNDVNRIMIEDCQKDKEIFDWDAD